jgi:hypothetical protein
VSEPQTDVEPTLLAMQAAAEAVRAANHAAYDAPRTPSSVYDRTGAMVDLLAKLEQLTEHIARGVGWVSANPHLRSTERDIERDIDPVDAAQKAQTRLLSAARFLDTARTTVNDAWSQLSTLYLKDAEQDKATEETG